MGCPMNFSSPVIARSAATNQSSGIAAVGFTSLAMTDGSVHQRCSEESDTTHERNPLRRANTRFAALTPDKSSRSR